MEYDFIDPIWSSWLLLENEHKALLCGSDAVVESNVTPRYSSSSNSPEAPLRASLYQIVFDMTEDQLSKEFGHAFQIFVQCKPPLCPGP